MNDYAQLQPNMDPSGYAVKTQSWRGNVNGPTMASDVMPDTSNLRGRIIQNNGTLGTIVLALGALLGEANKSPDAPPPTDHVIRTASAADEDPLVSRYMQAMALLDFQGQLIEILLNYRGSLEQMVRKL